MRRGGGVWVAVAAFLALAPARADDPDVRYWPLREVSFPVALDRIRQADPKPSKLRLFVARDGGRFEPLPDKTLSDLDVINPDKGTRGFRYTTPADGQYEFALQFLYPDGTARPRDSEISAQYRLVVDTRPPLVRVAASGPTGVEWSVEDENLAPDGVTVEVRRQGSVKWNKIQPRTFAARDRYNWKADDLRGRTLEVRVVGKDKAGLEMASRVITLPAGGSPTGLGDGGRLPAERTGSGFGGPDDTPGRPEMQYVNTRTLMIESKLTRLTRSGVKAAELWVNDGKSGWRKVTTQDENIRADDPDPVIKIPFKADKDGVYGFIVLPVNGAGGKQDDPRKDDPPQILVCVDTEKPVVQVKGVKVSPGGSVGPRVEIEWQVTETNLMPDPMVLEYAEDKVAGPWKRIAEKVANSGRYVWEVEDKNLWRFFVRAAAVDKAGNRGEHVYDKEVIIDLEKPAAVIEKVQGTGGPPSAPQHQADRPSLPTAPSDAPPVPKLPDIGK